MHDFPNERNSNPNDFFCTSTITQSNTSSNFNFLSISSNHEDYGHQPERNPFALKDAFACGTTDCVILTEKRKIEWNSTHDFHDNETGTLNEAQEIGWPWYQTGDQRETQRTQRGNCKINKFHAIS